LSIAIRVYRKIIRMELVIVFLLIISIAIGVWVLINQNKENGYTQIGNDLIRILDSLSKMDPSIRGEFARNRDENQKNSRESREELSNSIKALNESLQTAFKNTREELARSLKSFEEKFGQNVKDFNEIQKQKFDDLVLKQTQIKSETEIKLEKIRETVDNNLQKLQEQNSKKLEEMRNTVDEKLQSTLEKRFSESFKLISNRLDQVHQGLGEMQKLATGVGDLKKVLTNVKTRGNMGEFQLGNILEQIFSVEQFEKNVIVKPGTLERVEFAIKLPGRSTDGTPVLLPIDSKFPNEDYQRLVEVYEKISDLNPKDIEDAIKQFEYSVKKNAKDIKDKYLNPPTTTDFAIMFVPTEGLYAEILRRTGLFELLQREYRVTVVGPANLVAFLSSLQMGFRTLAIEKRSSEVWQILGAVKTQFGTFGGILEKTKKKLQEAANVIDDASVKSRVIERKLKAVQELTHEEAKGLLGASLEVSDDDSVVESDDPESEPQLPFQDQAKLFD
jgi:DNA recombination protein RmuC